MRQGSTGFKYFTKYTIWMMIGVTMVFFAQSVMTNIRNSPEKVELFYAYGVAILAIIIIVGVLLFLFSLVNMFLFIKKTSLGRKDNSI